MSDTEKKPDPKPKDKMPWRQRLAAIGSAIGNAVGEWFANR